MDIFHTYQIFRELRRDEESLLWQRMAALLVLNSIMLVAFFMSYSGQGYETLQHVIAWVAIVLCLIFGFLLGLGAGTLLEWKENLREIEEEPEFDYLREKKKRPQTDIGDKITKWEKWRDRKVKVPQYYSLSIPILFIIIWGFCLSTLATG